MQLVHGGDIQGYFEEYGSYPLDFSANVNPLGLPQGVKEALNAGMDGFAAYPDPLCRLLREKIAVYEGVPTAQILCGNGAADLIFRLAYALRPRRALVLAPTFAEYELALRAAGCAVDYFDLSEQDGFTVGERFCTAIEAGGYDLVFLCNPNNPTGLLCEPRIACQAAQACKRSGALLVADECFNDFLDEPEKYTLKPLLAQGKPVLILKAFTKIFAMAGLRLGYCLCADTELLERLRAAGQPWSVSGAAQTAGIAALREREYLQKTRTLIRTERNWLIEKMRELGLWVAEGRANYLLLRTEQEDLPAQMRKHGILIRSCANYRGLDARYNRIAVRTRAENERLINAFGDCLAAKPQGNG